MSFDLRDNLSYSILAVPIVGLISFLLSRPATVQEQPQTIPDGYSVSTIEVPKNTQLEVGGLAFAPNGDLYVTTRYGNVWLFRRGKWKKFADGLHNVLGIHIQQDSGRIFVVQKPELTELIDTDDDDRAERYRTVCDSWGFSGNYHEFAYGPVVDDKGNFYVALNLGHGSGGVKGAIMTHTIRDRGTVVKITPEGEMTTFAYGFRSPLGMFLNKDNELFVAENQGDWVATSMLHHVKKGNFYGHPASLADHPKYRNKNLQKVPTSEFNELRTDPVLWIPYYDQLSKSPGNPVLDTRKINFGPFDGQFFMGDQTQANILRMDLEKVNGHYQGVVFHFLGTLQSGVTRAKFDPAGNLWVGQTDRGWSSKGNKRYGIQRIEYDGSTVPFSIQTIKLTKTGFLLQFTRPVNKQAAIKPGNYSLKYWDYPYTPEYGSPPKKKRSVKVDSVKVAKNGRQVHLTLPELKKRYLYKIKVNVSSASGTELTNDTGYYSLFHKR